MEVNEQYKKVELRTLNVGETYKARVLYDDPATGTPDIRTKTIPGGISKKTGKSYNSFTVYSMAITHNGESGWWLGIPRGIVEKMKMFKKGDLLEFSKTENAGRVFFNVRKLEETPAQNIAATIKEKVGTIPADATAEDIADTMVDLGITGADPKDVLAEIKAM